MNLSRYAPWALAVLRIMAGLLFFEHGTQKLFGFPLRTGAAPSMFALFWFQGIIEIVGGALIALGLFTRPAAFILCGNMAVGYFMTFPQKNFFPAVSGGDTAILYCFIFFYLIFAGPGPISVDAMRGRR